LSRLRDALHKNKQLILIASVEKILYLLPQSCLKTCEKIGGVKLNITAPIATTATVLHVNKWKYENLFAYTNIISKPLSFVPGEKVIAKFKFCQNSIYPLMNIFRAICCVILLCSISDLHSF
jgi:hypothetical protein